MEFAEFQAELIAAEKRINLLQKVLAKLDETAVDERTFIIEEIRAAEALRTRISSLLARNTLDIF